MNSTIIEDVISENQQDPTAVIVLSFILFLSEIMPVLPIKQNGILHTIVTLLQKLKV